MALAVMLLEVGIERYVAIACGYALRGEEGLE